MTLEYGINFTDNSYISVTCGGPLRRIKYGHMSGNQIVTDATMYYDYTSAFGATVGNVYRLSSAKDGATGGEIRYTYDWDGKVKSVSEYADNYLGQSISFTYGNGYAEVRTSGTDDILQSGRTGDDIITHYSIDYMGHAVSAYSTNVARTAMYGATNRVYEANGSSDRTKNSIKSETVINGVATNYVYNGSFEYGSSQPLGWTLSDSQGMTLTVDGNGNAEQRLSIQTTPNTTKYVYQNVVLPSGTYTLSADCYVDGIDGATLRMAAIMVSDSSILAEQTYGMDYSASLQNSLCPVITFSVDGGRTGSAAVCVKFEVIGDDNASGNLHIDHVMLENNAGAGSYNAILFGGFENTLTQDADISLSDEWKFQYASGASVSDNGLNGKALKIEGNLNEYQSVDQIVSIVPSEAIQNGSVSTAPRTFTVSGFAMGSEQVPNEEAYFCLDVEIKYYNDSRIYLLYFDFNKDLTDWQFLSASFTTKPGKIVESITVECSYAYQPGVAYFDNISLVEETGNNYAGYSYTDDGLVEFMYTPSYCQYNEYDNITRDLLVTWDSDGNGISYQYENHVLQSQISFTYDTETNDLLSWYLSDRNDNNSSEWNPTTAAKAKTQYTINSYGLNTSTVSYPADGTKDSASQEEASAQLRSSAAYDLSAGSAVFGRVLSATDTSGQTTYYSYGSNGQLTYEKYNDGSGLYYMYDALGRLTDVYPLMYSPSVNAYYPNTSAERAEYSYNSKLQLQEISTSSTDYTYTYDSYGNVETISANGSLLASYTYGNNNGKLTALTYGNGIVMEYSYDELDRISEICYNVVDGESGEPVEYKYLYTYTASGEIHSVEGTESGRKYQYTYNSRGQMTGYTELILRHNSVGDDGYTDYTQSFFRYDELDRPDYTQTTFRYSLGNAEFLSASDCYDAVGYEYTYDNSESDRDEDDVGALIEFDIFGGGINHNAAITYHYDQLYRLDTKTVEANNGSGFAQTISYAYKMVGANHTSCLVDSYQSVIGATTTQYTYTYDSVGNITRVTDNAGNITRYQYDDLGQLTREDNPYLNKTYVYTYDNAGNRTSKKTYAYTTGTLGTVISRENYEYDGDRLTRVGSMQYTYDTIGNPTYYNGYKMEWEGRQLTKMSMNGGQFGYEFEYNADGIRTMKSSLGGTAHVYGLNGSQIQTETIGNKLLVYLYDESGSPIGLQYRTTSYAANRFDTYYFEKNLQGDIIAVYTEGGTKIGSYNYDAWGVCSYSYASGATSAQKQIVSTLNPFRYRGYYYDTETGFYYLQTRYYNPQRGRFLNADGYVNANGDLIGFNMYAYCGNNPIMYADPSGDFPWLFALISLALTVALVSSLTSCAERDESIITEEKEFENVLDAVMDFGTTYNPKSINDNVEYGTVIYEVTDGGKTYYTYTTVMIGGEKNVTIPHAPKGYTEVAMVHTHGREMNIYKGEVHSNDDKNNAVARNLKSYLFTPSNQLIYYYPNGLEGPVNEWDSGQKKN